MRFLEECLRQAPEARTQQTPEARTQGATVRRLHPLLKGFAVPGAEQGMANSPWPLSDLHDLGFLSPHRQACHRRGWGRRTERRGRPILRQAGDVRPRSPAAINDRRCGLVAAYAAGINLIVGLARLLPEIVADAQAVEARRRHRHFRHAGNRPTDLVGKLGFFLRHIRRKQCDVER